MNEVLIVRRNGKIERENCFSPKNFYIINSLYSHLDSMHDFFLFAWALFAEIAGTISGFGSSSIFLPIAHQFFNYETALILVALYHIFWNTARFSLFYRHWNAQIFFIFGIPSIFATALGANLVGMIDPNILKIILGIVLTLFALYSLLNLQFEVKATPTLWIIGGWLSGFTAWLIGTGWVLRGAFMTLFGLKKEVYIATIASIALLVDVTRIPIYFWNSFLKSQYFWYIPVLFIIAFSWSYIGKKIVSQIETLLLKKIILCWIIGMSFILVVQWFSSL